VRLVQIQRGLSQRKTSLAGAPLQNRSPPKKSLFGRQFAGKNPPRPAAAWAELIFAGKLSAGERLFCQTILQWGNFLWYRRYFNKGETYQFRDYLSRADFSWGKHFKTRRCTQDCTNGQTMN